MALKGRIKSVRNRKDNQVGLCSVSMGLIVTIIDCAGVVKGVILYIPLSDCFINLLGGSHVSHKSVPRVLLL